MTQQLSKNKIKLIHSLEKKKHRQKEGLFLAEGNKCVSDLIKSGYYPKTLIATEDWLSTANIPSETEIVIASPEEIRKASLLQHPQQVMGLFTFPKEPNKNELRLIPQHELCLCLDGVQDPGNLGTIIRTADWFGIRHIFCNETTVDAYNPKTVQATMGSITRVHIHYLDLTDFISSLINVSIIGTTLDGENLYDTNLLQKGIIVMGNEGNGISEEIKSLLTQKVLIPSYPQHSNTAESLNVSIATAIICAEIRRRC